MAIEIAKTLYGDVRGESYRNYTVFKGVPYAKPPIGKVRWKAPEEPDSWSDIRETTKFQNKCYQFETNENDWSAFYHKEFYSNPEYHVPMSEDCLYLNIWTPAQSIDEKLPVAFWIHGGGYSGGYGSEMEFDGEEFCKRKVILVTVNYRVGVFGFLSHPWLSEETEHKESGNYGILDQIMALKWVYKNIAAFGGDPSRITIFGQSAGSMSVQTLLCSNLATDMIHGAIMQSGSGLNDGIKRLSTKIDLYEAGNELIKRLDVDNINELRAISAETILQHGLEISNQHMKSGKGLIWLPHVDGYVLEDKYDKWMGQGKFPNIPYMIGCVEKDLNVTSEMLDRGEKGPLYHSAIEWSFHCERTGRRPGYVYYFDHQPLGDHAGAFHSVELWYMFGTLNRSWRPKNESDYRVSRQMIDYWCNFFKYGNPNGLNDEGWKVCTETEPYIHTFS